MFYDYAKKAGLKPIIGCEVYVAPEDRRNKDARSPRDAGYHLVLLAQNMLEKLCDLRIFPDEAGKLNVGLRETGGGLLLVSQFTLYASCRKGRRPSFSDAAPPDVAREIYARLVERAGAALSGKVAGGRFGADMCGRPRARARSRDGASRCCGRGSTPRTGGRTA